MLITSFVFPLVMTFEVALSKKEVLLVNKPHGYVYRQTKAKDAPDPSNNKKNALQFSYFNEVGNKTFSFRIFIYNDPENQVHNDKRARQLLGQYCEKYKSDSVEQNVRIQTKFTRETVPVLYCAFTDSTLAKARQLKPGQFRNVTLALVRQKGYVFFSVAYSNRTSGKLYRRFLNTLSSLYIQNRI